MITDAGTKRPMTEGDLQQASGLSLGNIRHTLLMLGADGLVRPLGREQVVWEIAHDFIARVLGQILGRLRAPRWRRAFAYATPVLAVVWLLTTAGVAALVIERAAATAMQKLTAMGFMFQDMGSEGLMVTGTSLKPGAVDVLQSHYRDLPAISQLYIGGDKEIQVLRLPNNAEMLRQLYVSGNERLVRIEGLAGLKKLKYLSISGNSALASIGDLAALSELENLDITQNGSLTAIEGLAGLANLKTLTIYGNPKLAAIDGLDSLTKLQFLAISGAGLASIEGLASLSALQSVVIADSPLLANIPGLANLTNLQALDMSGNIPLVTKALEGLTSLRNLTISSNPTLATVGLAGLTNLHTLMIKANLALATVDLAGLTNLQTLAIMDNPALATINGLKDLTNLSSLLLDGPYSSAALARCARRPALSQVYLESRPELREAAAQLQVLRKQHSLPDVDFYFTLKSAEQSAR